jgi:hypothetical protein
MRVASRPEHAPLRRATADGAKGAVRPTKRCRARAANIIRTADRAATDNILFPEIRR